MDINAKNVKAIAGLIALGVAYIFYNQGKNGFVLIFTLLGMIFVGSASNDKKQIDATNGIRKTITDMGYSSNDVEPLTERTVSVLREEYAQRKQTKAKQESSNSFLDIFLMIMSVLTGDVASEWTRCTETEIVNAIHIGAALMNLAPPQR